MTLQGKASIAGLLKWRTGLQFEQVKAVLEQLYGVLKMNSPFQNILIQQV